ncbi:MAG TPA: DUF4190 domain-containing protein [Candidatus Dormibacteraeota bacterium]|nr:DUF4190 domain-containing protein [Candidatus Dormibacteraeota bacterium]
MSLGPPTSGHVSPDGKWWWDGSKWVPMPATGAPALVPAQAAPSPPSYQQTAGTPAAVFVYGPRTNSAAVASLVFGIISWFVCPVVGGVLAVVFGHVARGQIRQSGESGGGLAIAGLILGYFHLAAALIVGFIWLVIVGGTFAAIGAIGHLPTPSP